MFKMAGVGLEKISVIDMCLFIEKELRGGISYIYKRCSEANITWKIFIQKNRQNA